MAEAAQKTFDGQFDVTGTVWENVPSGYYCRRCSQGLLVGSRECPQCAWRFSVSTMPRKSLENRPDWAAAMSKERRTLPEVIRARQIAQQVTAAQIPPPVRWFRDCKFRLRRRWGWLEDGVMPSSSPKPLLDTDLQQEHEPARADIRPVLAMVTLLFFFSGFMGLLVWIVAVLVGH